MYNASGELIVAAVSAWTVLDLTTRRLTALPEELAAVYPVNTIPCIPFPSRTIPRLREGRLDADLTLFSGDGATTSTSTDMSITQSILAGCLSVCRGPPVKASSRPCST